MKTPTPTDALLSLHHARQSIHRKASRLPAGDVRRLLYAGALLINRERAKEIVERILSK